jgi:hypothetical protein
VRGKTGRVVANQEISCVEGHRFEIGECVTYIEKHFPNGVRRTELVVIERLTGAGEPRYQLRWPDGLAQCVFAQSQLRPTPSTHETTRRLDALAPGEPARDGSRWSA